MDDDAVERRLVRALRKISSLGRRPVAVSPTGGSPSDVMPSPTVLRQAPPRRSTVPSSWPSRRRGRPWMDEIEPAIVEGAVPCRLGEARLTHGVGGDQSVVPGDERFEELQLHTRRGCVAGGRTGTPGPESAIWAAERPANRTGDRLDRKAAAAQNEVRRGGHTLVPMGAGELVTKDLERVVACLRAGGLAVVPTETVYGLAADAEQPAAVARIFEVKGRPPTHPLIVHVGAVYDLPTWVADVPLHAAVLAETCWPGPLTLLLQRSSRPGRRHRRLGHGWHPGPGPPGDSRGPGSHRLRPRRPVGEPLRMGESDDRPARPRRARRAARSGEGRHPRRRSEPGGVESTIVDCTVDPPQILRPGGIPTETVAELIGTPIASPSGPARAAGMVTSHYAPRARVHLVDRPIDATAAASRWAPGIEVRVIDGTETSCGTPATSTPNSVTPMPMAAPT